MVVSESHILKVDIMAATFHVQEYDTIFTELVLRKRHVFQGEREGYILICRRCNRNASRVFREGRICNMKAGHHFIVYYEVNTCAVLKYSIFNVSRRIQKIHSTSFKANIRYFSAHAL